MYENCTSVEACSLGPSILSYCTVASFLTFTSYLENAALNNPVISGIPERVQPVDVPDDDYDFIVVGGGAGGSVVASRLSENSTWKVLLLEAGHDETLGFQIPAFQGMSEMLGEVNWGYVTTNETNACLSNGGSCAWGAAKMLGGSTSTNAMLYLRGNPTDFNNWAELGNEGWTWEEVLPYFKKAENNSEIERVGTEYHSTGGPLSVGRFPYRPPFSDVLLAAVAELGHNFTEDFNGEQNSGWTEMQTMNKNGVRHSAAAAYLRPARDRKNLHVSLNSFVTKIIFENNTAVGVQYLKNNVSRKAYARKEVILAAGAKRSPHLLLLSGIGPKEHLKSVGIDDIIKDLPGVGENLHDHAVNRMDATINEEDVYVTNYDVVEQYMANQTGPLSAEGSHTIQGLIASSKTTSDFPDIQIGLTGYWPRCAPGEVGALQSTGKLGLKLWTTYLHTKSRGKLSLASKDPLDDPVITGGYLSNTEDLDVLVEAAEIAMQLLKTKTMQAYNVTLTDTSHAKCLSYTKASEEYWRCVIPQGDPSYLHDVGSCKMGPKSDPMAVVDPQLRVHGVNGLRVADASIMPQVISGNTAAPTIMIGERCADFIKTQYA